MTLLRLNPSLCYVSHSGIHFQPIIFEVDCKVLARVLGNKMYPRTYSGGIVEAIEKIVG